MFQRRSEADFSRELEESIQVLKGFFLEEINQRFREKVRLIFLENWRNQFEF